MREPLIEPPVEDDLLTILTDPPLTDHGDQPIDKKGQPKDVEKTAKTFNQLIQKHNR